MRNKQIAAVLVGMFMAGGVYAAGLDDFGGLKLRGNGTVDDSQPGVATSSDDIVGGIKFRGDGSVDDSQPGQAGGSDDIVGGVKLRGDGSVDDSQPTQSSVDDDIVNGVKVRGDGSVDDSQPGTASPKIKLRNTAFAVNADGSTTETTTKTTTVNNNTLRTRVETVTRTPGGSKLSRTRVDTRFNEAGEIVRQRFKVK